MCTSIRIKGESVYFGRNMDIGSSFGERIVFTPRNYTINFKAEKRTDKHFAILGMAAVIDSYPLYADAFNEHGLCIAGLSFPSQAYYRPLSESDPQKLRIAPFELPLFLLSTCKSVEECKTALKSLEIVDVDFSENVKNTPLHWHIADASGSIVAEAVKGSLNVTPNNTDVLTNSPVFEFHLQSLAGYQNLSSGRAENCLSHLFESADTGKGHGAHGLPGDFSSTSRFVKAAYLTALSKDIPSRSVDLAHLFALLLSVSVPKGAVMEKELHHTLYTCGIDVKKREYSVFRYGGAGLKTVSMCDMQENSDELMCFK